jgi:hypothetical protein
MAAGKSKVFQLQAWTGLEASSSHISRQSAHECVKPYVPAAFTPVNIPGTHFC